jgi:signal transduction histidine kinase
MPTKPLNAHLKTALLIGLLAAFLFSPERSHGSFAAILVTWFAACLLAEVLWHPAHDEVTLLTMAPAAQLAALATVPALWGLAIVPVAAFAGDLLWRARGWRRAALYGLGCAVPALAALAIFRFIGFHGTTTGEGSPGHFLREPGEIAGLVMAGVIFIALSQLHRAAMAARTREASPLRVWREVFGSETELVTSAALITVFVLALFCYEVLGYRGLLLCVMPLLFVRDGSRRYIELEAAQSRLIQNERLAAKGEMAAEIGHELNNYLAAVSGRAQLLLRSLGETSEDGLVTEARRVHDLSSQMAGLAKGLMDFSRREAHKAPAGLNELVEKTVDFVRPQTRFRGVNFRFNPEPDLPRVTMDPGQLQQVLLALFGRMADQASAATRNLDIRTFTDERRRTAGIEILTPRSADTAFEAGEPGAAESDESALGVVVRILDRHQGRLEVGPASQNGDTYRVFLPAA